MRPTALLPFRSKSYSGLLCSENIHRPRPGLNLSNWKCIHYLAASWCKWLGARLPPLGSRVCVSVSPCGFRCGWNGVWVGFSRGFSHFPLPQISFRHFSTLISSISFHFSSPCDGASDVVGRHPCYSRTYNIGASSHLIPRPDLVLDTSWGYLFIYSLSIESTPISWDFSWELLHLILGWLICLKYELNRKY